MFTNGTHEHIEGCPHFLPPLFHLNSGQTHVTHMGTDRPTDANITV